MKALLIVFAIRHMLGIALFVWLVTTARAADGPGWLVIAGLGGAYGTMAIYNGSRLYGRFRRRVTAEQSQA